MNKNLISEYSINEGIKQKFPNYGGGLFIILLIVYTVIRKIEEFKLPTQRLPLNNKASSLLSSRSTPLLKPQCKTPGFPCDSDTTCTFDLQCIPNNQMYAKNGEPCNRLRHPFCTNNTACYHGTCRPIPQLKEMKGVIINPNSLMIPQNPPANCRGGMECPNGGICMDGPCYDLFNI